MISKRNAGVLLPLSSIASRYGIGCLSREAYEFIDFLADAGQSYWQMLPFGQTGFGDSPYQSVSAFAGNPYFIDPVTLIEDGLLKGAEARINTPGMQGGNWQWRLAPHFLSKELAHSIYDLSKLYGRLYKSEEELKRFEAME